MNSQKYFPQLTGLRAVAALLVFIHHFALAEEKVGKFLFRLQNELYIGVTIFFVLSGFLITLRYYRQKISLRQYALNRLARIYPMYLLLTVITFIFYYFYPTARYADHALGTHPTFSFLMDITFLRGFFDELKFTGVAQGWTLTVEECFYFLAPAIFFLLRKKVKLFVILLVLYAIGTGLVLLPKGANTYGFFSSFQFMLITTFFGRCFDFFVGVQLALWFGKRDGVRSSGKTYYSLIGCILLLLVILSSVSIDVSKARFEYSLYTTPGLIINNWILPVAVGILLWGLITERTIITRVLSTPLFDILGKSSYTFYLIHMGVISLAVVYAVQKFVFHLPAMLIISVILYKMVEEPLNKLVRNLGKKRKDVIAPTSIRIEELTR
jgi:peptidoglycan/LPS O-acetylase OafA/YrhL